MADQENNYVVGRGRLFFGQFRKGTRKALGQAYFGNTPELSTSQDEETLDHYSSEAGVRVKDASVTLQNDASASFQCDNISNRNLALWFRGEVVRRIEAGSMSASGTITFSVAPPADGDSVTINGIEIEFTSGVAAGMQVKVGGTLAATATALANFINDNTAALKVTAVANAAIVTVTSASPGTGGNDDTLAKSGANIAVSGAALAGGTDVTENLALARGLWFQLGVDATTPQGVRNVGSVVIAGVDEDSYIVEADTGRIFVNEDAADVADGGIYEITYGVAAAVEDIVIAKGETIEGELLFLANNAAGENKDYLWPYVKLTPDGDFSLKGDDWQNMTFNVEILKRDAVTERQIITTRRRAA